MYGEENEAKERKEVSWMNANEKMMMQKARELRDLVEETYPHWRMRYIVRLALVKFIIDPRVDSSDLAKTLNSLEE